MTISDETHLSPTDFEHNDRFRDNLSQKRSIRAAYQLM
jgi:hypothetical protein